MGQMTKQIAEVLTFFCLLFSSCHAQESDSEKIFNTINRVTYCVNKLDTACVFNFLNKGAIQSGSNTNYDIKYAYYFMKKYHDNKIDSLKYTRDSAYDDLGRMKFSVHLFNGFDTLTGITKADLNIYIGPKQLFGFESITGLELETDLDLNYRDKLYKENALLEIDEILKRMK